MADHFLGALKQIERRSENNILIFSDVLSERLETIAFNMVGKEISDNDYLKLLELYYNKFLKEQKKDAMYYCVYRMQQIQRAKDTKKKNKRIHLIEFSENYDAVSKAFLDLKKPFYERFRLRKYIHFIYIDTFVFIFHLALFVLLFHFSFAFSLISLSILWVIGLIFYYEYGMDYAYQKELDLKSKSVDLVLLNIDSHIFSRIQFQTHIKQMLKKAHI